MTAYAAPLRDIDYVLNHLCDLGGLAQLDSYRHAEPELVRDLVGEAARFLGDTVAPLNRVGDLEGSVRNADGTVTTPEGFQAAYAAYVAGGWGGVAFDQEFGGGGFPWLVGVALQEILTSANMAFSLCPLLTQGAIDALTHHGSQEQQLTYLPKMITGEWTGTMNLTEPEAGSDVGAVRTRAVREADGTYRISGTKIFITYGEHDMAENIIHLVLARTPDAAPGTKGISCFIVPKYLVNPDGSLGERNDVTCVSIEHKLGIHASPTCVLSYGERGGAVGYLIGEEQRGMATMFTMMNQARLSVGLEGLAIGERAAQQALAFAQERRQGRAPGAPAGVVSPIIEHPDVQRMLLTMKATNEALRRLVYWNAASIDLAKHHPDADERAAASDLAALLTPLSKAWGTDMGLETTSLALQVHGGMGYVEETGVAQHVRDARIAPIYEGTNGIQAIDLVGRKVPMGGGAVLRAHLDRIGALDGELSAYDELALSRKELATALAVVTEASTWLLEHGADQRAVLAGATPYLRLLATLTGGYLMARSALVALDLLGTGSSDYDEAFLRAKVVTGRFFCEQLLPQTNGLAAAATAGSAWLEGVDAQLLAD